VADASAACGCLLLAEVSGAYLDVKERLPVGGSMCCRLSEPAAASLLALGASMCCRLSEPAAAEGVAAATGGFLAAPAAAAGCVLDLSAGPVFIVAAACPLLAALG
jgi:hypothetical protein